jgi:hypothetical protein
MFDIFIMDMGGNDANVQDLVQRFPHARVVRYYDNHLDTLKRCISHCRTPYAWVISSCCDYTEFDFNYRAKPWEAYQLHCWASGSQQYGDTFLVPIAEFKRQQAVELLEWYKDINWHSDGVPRLPWPRVTYSTDNLIEVIKSSHFNTPYLLFSPDYHDSDIDYEPALWRQKMRNIHGFSTGNSLVLVPKDAQTFVDVQVYDYPYILKQNTVKDPQQDIIFISYDEPNADANWEILSSKYPHARRLHGVEGMEKALLKAAEMSSTDWYYAVFAKTELHPDFDFSYSPDLFQEPKHYIFHAENPLNGLRYGHMGVVLYNCGIVKSITEFGIDYTMSAAHAVIPITSAIARFNSNPYQTWRTAFREAGKLAQFCDENDNVENSYRLGVWTSEAEGEHSEWCLQGARDGVMFYHANKEDKTQLKNAFNWVWLREYFSSLYQDTNSPNLTDLQRRQLLWQQQ